MHRTRLWSDHAATPKQRERHGMPTQRDVLISMLRDAHGRGQAVLLPDIMLAGIAQHGARLREIRQRGFVVRNELERSPDGRVLSRYWLECDPEKDGSPCE